LIVFLLQEDVTNVLGASQEYALKENRQALQLMRQFLKADLRSSTRIALPGPQTKERRRSR
jgi:hypothetical protein